jgi:hypothetical protein
MDAFPPPLLAQTSRNVDNNLPSSPPLNHVPLDLLPRRLVPVLAQNSLYNILHHDTKLVFIRHDGDLLQQLALLVQYHIYVPRSKDVAPDVSQNLRGVRQVRRRSTHGYTRRLVANNGNVRSIRMKKISLARENESVSP